MIYATLSDDHLDQVLPKVDWRLWPQTDDILMLLLRMLVVDEALGRAEWQTYPGWFVRWVKLAAMVDSLCTFGIQTGRIFWEQVKPQDVPVKNIGSGRKRRTTRKTLLNLDILQSLIFFSFGFSVFFLQKVENLAYPC